MKRQWLVGTLVALSWMAVPGWGQTKSDEADALRGQIQALQEKLFAAEKKSLERRRVTQLGTSRVKEKEEEPVLVVRVYDLSDLFSLAPPYPALRTSDLVGSGNAGGFFPGATAEPGGVGMGGAGMGGMGAMGGMGGGIFSVKSGGEKPNPTPTGSTPPAPPSGGITGARTSLEDLIDAITSTIAQTEWDSVGGPGSIAPLGNSLIISTTERNHEQIATLLDTLRQRWKTLRTISIEAHWLWLTEGQLGALLVSGPKPAKPDEPRAYGLVDDKAWISLCEGLQKEKKDRPAGYHAVVTCYNGQTVHCVSGGQSLAVIGMIPVVGGGAAAGEAGSVGYQPGVSVVHQGAALQLTPIASTGGRFVTLDVHSRVVWGEPLKTAKGTPQEALLTGPMAVAAAIDRPLLTSHELETTFRAPVDRRILVGGMTCEIQPGPGEPNLYLFVKVAMQELRDEPPETKSESKPAHLPGTSPKR